MPHHQHNRFHLPAGEGENRTYLTTGTIGPLSLWERDRVRGTGRRPALMHLTTKILPTIRSRRLVKRPGEDAGKRLL